MIRDEVRREKVKRRILKAVAKEHKFLGHPPRMVDICQFGRRRAEAQYWLNICRDLIEVGELCQEVDEDGSILRSIAGDNGEH